MDTELKPCATHWCDELRVITTTFHKSYKDEATKTVVRYIEVEHSCPKCHVRTPQLSPRDALNVWNDAHSTNLNVGSGT